MTKVVYIDDDPDDLEFFNIAIEEIDLPIKLVTYTNPLEAIREMKSMDPKPDFIFLDVNIRPIDGKRSLILMKKDPVLRTIPVIMHSTGNDPDEKRSLLDNGAQQYLPKQSSISKLKNLLQPVFVGMEVEKRERLHH
jgi:CheY-like chemotaxis protein